MDYPLGMAKGVKHIAPQRGSDPAEETSLTLTPNLRSNSCMSKKVEVNRSAVTGKFVTETYAKSHPKTTEKETYKRK